MSGKAVVAYIFPDTDDVNVIKEVVAVTRPYFEHFPELKIHAAVGKAADTIAYFTENGNLPDEVEEESDPAEKVE